MRGLNIIEAIQKTCKETPYITREAWDRQFEPAPGHRILLMPTDTPDCIIALSSRDGIRSYPRWNPTKEDLLADDWFSVGPDLTADCYDAFIKAGWHL